MHVSTYPIVPQNLSSLLIGPLGAREKVDNARTRTAPFRVKSEHSIAVPLVFLLDTKLAHLLLCSAGSLQYQGDFHFGAK